MLTRQSEAGRESQLRRLPSVYTASGGPKHRSSGMSNRRGRARRIKNGHRHISLQCPSPKRVVHGRLMSAIVPPCDAARAPCPLAAARRSSTMTIMQNSIKPNKEQGKREAAAATPARCCLPVSDRSGRSRLRPAHDSTLFREQAAPTANLPGKPTASRPPRTRRPALKKSFAFSAGELLSLSFLAEALVEGLTLKRTCFPSGSAHQSILPKRLR